MPMYSGKTDIEISHRADKISEAYKLKIRHFQSKLQYKKLAQSWKQDVLTLGGIAKKAKKDIMEEQTPDPKILSNMYINHPDTQQLYQICLDYLRVTLKLLTVKH